jgi:hypothetical protein
MLLLLKILSSIVLTGIGVGFVLACLAAAWFFALLFAKMAVDVWIEFPTFL